MSKKPAPELPYISADLRPLAVPIETLAFDPRNARKHDQKNLNAIKTSLQKFGQVKPIVVAADGKTVLAGNGALASAKALGWSHIAIVRSGMEGGEATAFGLADNRTGELSTWDRDTLSELLAELHEQDGVDYLDGIGWSDDEITALISSQDAAAGNATASEPMAVDDSQAQKEDGLPGMGRPLSLTVEQREIVDKVVAAIREDEDESLTEGRCIELALADYWAGRQS